MTLEFQWNVFKYIVQIKEGHKYIPLLDKSIFDSAKLRLLFGLVQDYYEKFSSAPSRVNCLEYFDISTKKANITKDIYNSIDDAIRKLYQTLDSDICLIRERIIISAQRQMTENMFTEYSDKISDDIEVFTKLRGEMNKIVKLGEESDDEESKGFSILHDYQGIPRDKFDGNPCFLNGLNNLTTAKGFLSPQLIIFMGGPKSFKTGFLINMAVDYMRSGFKVYYADAENGETPLMRRIYQCLLECTYDELFGVDISRALGELLKKCNVFGGDLRLGCYPSGVKTVQDVEMELESLRAEKGFVPDIIIWDDPDNFLANDFNKRKELRHNIHGVYVDILNLNKKLGVFSLGVSQVNRGAIGKPVIDMKDFSEDINKARKCHAAFAICRTEEEMNMGTARIIPVLQRDGKGYNGHNQCVIEIDESRMTIKETDFISAAKNINREKLKDE